jgi:hypothetical protein
VIGSRIDLMVQLNGPSPLPVSVNSAARRIEPAKQGRRSKTHCKSNEDGHDAHDGRALV